jgi:hypothetical protein
MLRPGRVAQFSLLWCLFAPLVAGAQAANPSVSTKDSPISQHAEGTFDVKNSPLPADDALAGTTIGRFGLDKQFHGDLEAISKGEMLGAGNPATGTAGYVAIEQVTGSLQGHKGSFALQHLGTMEGGKFDLKVIVVPGSGSGDLAGISGSMQIIIAAGKHSYKFDYSLPAVTK